MFCPLHSNISKEQHEKYHLAIMENTENTPMKCAPHISVRDGGQNV